jgi:4-diphosphocytidyl-2-C-methyl-D-erythritol kinase
MRFFAAAKINLMLHVTTRKADGYHTLQSAMALTDMGDVLHVDPAPAYTLSITGPFAHHAPDTPDNLITKAIRLLEQTTGKQANISIRLQKNLPAGAGLGGGSADAAAAMHAQNAIWGQPLTIEELCSIGLSIGAEMPFMLQGKPARVEGIGEILSPIDLPALPAVTIWPGVSLATKDVFKNNTAYSDPINLPENIDFEWIKTQHNDLQNTAISLCPEINTALQALSHQTGCILTRMTGSGASVFGIFETMDHAMQAAHAIAAQNKKDASPWWVRACMINPQK